MPSLINRGIMTNGKNMNGNEIKAAFLTPNVLIIVCVPVFLSASLSVISLVIDPPIKKSIAMNPMANGTACNGFPNTLHDASIPSNPLGMATQS